MHPSLGPSPLLFELVRTSGLVVSGARLRAQLTARPALPRGLRLPRLSSHQWLL